MVMKKIITKGTLLQLITNASYEKRARIIGRALVCLLNRQTDDEKRDNDTKVTNLRGFSQCDSRAGSITAKYFLKHGKLLDWQMDNWLKTTKSGYPKICKYHRQLNEEANSKLQKQQ